MIKIKQINYWLNKPYPYREEIDFQISVSFILGFFVFIILYFLKPFGLHILDNNLIYYFSGYGIITTVILLLFFFILAPAFPYYFKDASWTVKKEILSTSGVISVIGILAYFYHNRVAVGNYDKNLFTLIYFIKYTASIAIFPVILYVYLTEIFLTNKKKTVVHTLKNKIKPALKGTNKAKKGIVTVLSSNKKNELNFHVSNLVYVNSDGNYVSFFLKEDSNRITEKIMRVQLQTVTNVLDQYNNIIRCHKSYIINTDFVIDITGNARAYYLHLSVAKTKIPVSRKFKKEELIELIS